MAYEDKFEELLGKVLVSITVSDDKERVEFETADGDRFMMYHSQDCCEHVSIEDISGDLNDLIGNPLLVAEESTSEEDPEGVNIEDSAWRDSFTWTFYKLATIKGSVDIRWYGESNGFYSEGVDFEKIPQQHPNH